MPAARAAARSLTFHAILLTAAVVMLLPFAWMVTTSLTPSAEILSPSLRLMSFGIFFMRHSIMTIPDELLDAARIDGASEFYIYRRVVLPLSKPALGALAILAVQNAWAFFIWPMIVTSDRSRFTMELGLAMFQRAFTVEYGRITAGPVVNLISPVTSFLFLPPPIILGVTLAGLQG